MIVEIRQESIRTNSKLTVQYFSDLKRVTVFLKKNHTIYD